MSEHTPHEACLHCVEDPMYDPALKTREVMGYAQQYIECPGCGARGPNCATKREAWAAWNKTNRRTPTESREAVLEEALRMRLADFANARKLAGPLVRPDDKSIVDEARAIRALSHPGTGG